jgi:flavin reductase (DIM6/NTAB) family NADH-FMN oxidoreductase RutF
MEGLLEELARAMIIDPAGTTPRNIYALMTGLIVPRPIAFVSSMNAGGARNLAPFSFFTGICANPPVICFSPMTRGAAAAQKDTARNIAATREFVVNMVSEAFAARMNIASTEFPPDVDEFEASGLTPLASDLVSPPRVAEAPACMECRLLQIIPVSALPLGGSLVIGEVLRFHVNDDIIEGFRVDPDRWHPIGRMNGPVYTRTTDRFNMPRPGAGS